MAGVQGYFASNMNVFLAEYSMQDQRLQKHSFAPRGTNSEKSSSGQSKPKSKGTAQLLWYKPNWQTLKGAFHQIVSLHKSWFECFKCHLRQFHVTWCTFPVAQNIKRGQSVQSHFEWKVPLKIVIEDMFNSQQKNVANAWIWLISNWSLFWFNFLSNL